MQLKHIIPSYLALLMVIFIPGQGYALTVDMDTADGISVPLNIYPTDGDRLIIWLPGEYGLSERQQPTIKSLVERGFEVYVPDLHTAWFTIPGRYSLSDVPPEAISDIIQVASNQGKKIFIMASGRTAALALTGIKAWEKAHPDHAPVAGVILLHPKLYRSTPEGGEDAELLPIAHASQLPIYLFQPELSANIWHVGQVVQTLQKGGSQVFFHKLKGVGDGFNVTPNAVPEDMRMTEKLPLLLEQAIDMLEGVTIEAKRGKINDDLLETPERKIRKELLKKYDRPIKAPGLELSDLEGQIHDINDYEDTVLLVNFWTTWCPPCVREIPSLERLNNRLSDKGLKILSVDVGEPVEKIRGFLENISISFPVLLDTEGEAFRAWKGYAFPTTLIVDRQQNIRYAVFGAFEWDSQEIIDTLTSLIQEEG